MFPFHPLVNGDKEIRTVILQPLPPLVEISEKGKEFEFKVRIAQNGDCSHISLSLEPNDHPQTQVNCNGSEIEMEFKNLQPGTKYFLYAAAIQEEARSSHKILETNTKPAKPELIAQEFIESRQLTSLKIALRGWGYVLEYCVEEENKQNCLFVPFELTLRLQLDERFNQKQIALTVVGFDNQRSKNLSLFIGNSINDSLPKVSFALSQESAYIIGDKFQTTAFVLRIPFEGIFWKMIVSFTQSGSSQHLFYGKSKATRYKYVLMYSPVVKKVVCPIITPIETQNFDNFMAVRELNALAPQRTIV